MKLLLTFPILLLAGCASGGGRCVGDFDYQHARVLPPLQSADGVKAPESPSALRIPPEPKQPVGYAERVPDPEHPGKTATRCLDTPPRMTEEATPVTPKS